MKQKTPMMELIEHLESQRKTLKEMDLLGFLMENEYIHKSNQINTIILKLGEYKEKEKQMVVDAFDAGVRTNYGIQTDDVKSREKYFTQTFE